MPRRAIACWRLARCIDRGRRVPCEHTEREAFEGEGTSLLGVVLVTDRSTCGTWMSIRIPTMVVNVDLRGDRPRLRAFIGRASQYESARAFVIKSYISPIAEASHLVKSLTSRKRVDHLAPQSANSGLIHPS